ncbi:TRAP transporter substrate-binding protein [uncultured Sulfitobacter sp.]|uniref:TRAP transporter substrate-binding protein n=1 Tax=uncultured Sulfitobacter sp. TaxID=191468 RepID=UPI002597C701|nr:TRAP transporter substrate-binding protein [uncultured Sulfitobacter sp.]
MTLTLSITRRRLFAGFALAAGLATGLSSVPAAAETPMLMASGYPDSNFMTVNIRMFLDEIADTADISVDLKSNGALIPLNSIKGAVQKGQVQLGEVRLGVHANEEPMLDLAGVPFVAPDYSTVWLLKDFQKDYVSNWFESQGLVLLYQAPWPGAGFYTKGPMQSLENLKGKRLRIPNTPMQSMGNLLGYNAVLLPFAEVPQAFSTGLIDAMFTSPQTGIDIQAWDHTDHFTYVGASLATNAVFMNRRAFDALTPDQQAAIQVAAEHAELRGWEMSAAATEAQIVTLQDNGMTIGTLPADIAARLDEIAPQLVGDWLEIASPEAVEVYQRYQKLR